MPAVTGEEPAQSLQGVAASLLFPLVRRFLAGASQVIVSPSDPRVGSRRSGIPAARLGETPMEGTDAAAFSFRLFLYFPLQRGGKTGKAFKRSLTSEAFCGSL